MHMSKYTRTAHGTMHRGSGPDMFLTHKSASTLSAEKAQQWANWQHAIAEVVKVRCDDAPELAAIKKAMNKQLNNFNERLA